jgi:hypothetical protein
MDIKSVCNKYKVSKAVLQAVSLLPSRDIPVSLLSSYVQMVCEGTDEKQFSAALHVMKERSLSTCSEDGERLTFHPLIQQTIQQCVIDQDNERQSVLSGLSATLIQLLPSLDEIQTGHKLTDGNVVRYESQLYHVARLTLDYDCKSLATQSVVDLACELSLWMENVDVAHPLCFGCLGADRRSGSKKRLT